MRRFGGFGVKSDYYRNKHLLGELTIGDFMEIVEIEGEFTRGKNWLPITRVRRSKDRPVVGIFMYSASVEADAVIPLDSKVRLRGDILEVMADLVDSRYHRIRIRLERVPPILEGSGPAGVVE